MSGRTGSLVASVLRMTVSLSGRASSLTASGCFLGLRLGRRLGGRLGSRLRLRTRVLRVRLHVVGLVGYGEEPAEVRTKERMRIYRAMERLYRSRQSGPLRFTRSVLLGICAFKREQ